MNWNRWTRQFHRWMAVVLTVAFIVNFIFFGLGQKEYPVWLGFLTLTPLGLLQLTGMYLFVLPYAAKWRSARRTDV